MNKHAWNLSDLKDITKHNINVFSCFHCGGGSTMGYKRAGLNVLGGVEIDPEMMSIYRVNHNPIHSYLMGVEEFNKLPNESLPAELFNLDILDGSPPCSSFSMSGSREKKWGVKKKFREGQADQILDDLFFHFIETANKLKPKIVIAENVKGMLSGNAKGYLKKIFAEFAAIGYDVQLFLLNAAYMGVPQRRERVFFVCRRRDLNLPKLVLDFNEPLVSFKDATHDLPIEPYKELTPTAKKYWYICEQGKSFSSVHHKGSLFNWIRLSENEPSNTIPAKSDIIFHPTIPRRISGKEIIRLQSFPDDYNFLTAEPGYVCGMSVPPKMTERIAYEIISQWLKNT